MASLDYASLLSFLEEQVLLVQVLCIGAIPVVLTALSTLPVPVGRAISDKALGMGLGFAADVMLVASFTSLLLPALEMRVLSPRLHGICLGSYARSFA